jgi:hypothetical protein
MIQWDRWAVDGKTMMAEEEEEELPEEEELEEEELPEEAEELPEGGLAVLYDKNKMEAWGYAAALAELAAEPVLLVPFYDTTAGGGEEESEDSEAAAPKARFRSDGVLEVRCTRAAAESYRSACIKWPPPPADAAAILR